MHFHNWYQLEHFTDVPTSGDHAQGRTNFLVLACACGVATIFPIENYLHTRPAFQRKLIETLKRAGLELDTGL